MNPVNFAVRTSHLRPLQYELDTYYFVAVSNVLQNYDAHFHLVHVVQLPKVTEGEPTLCLCHSDRRLRYVWPIIL